MVSEHPVITSFSEPNEFLQAVINHRKMSNPKFSIRKWARELGYSSPGYFINVVNGTRRLTSDHVSRVSRNLCLGKKDQQTFLYMVNLKNSKSDVEKKLYTEQISRLKKKTKIDGLSLDKFNLIKDWYNLAILEMVSLKNFKPEGKYISHKLFHRIGRQTAEMVINRLIRLKLVKYDHKQKLIRSDNQLYIGKEVPSEAIKEHHLQFMDLATYALKNSPVTERDFSGSTISVKSEDIPKLKKIISRFHKELHSIACYEDADVVYRANVQLFPITNKEGSHEE